MTNDRADTTETSNDVSRPQHSTRMTGLKQAAAVSGAVACLILAGIGFFLPVLPCTPFVLLASYLLLQCSPDMHRRLRTSRFFGRILRDWEDRKGIRPADKVRAIVIVIAGLVLSFSVGNLSSTLRFTTLILVLIGLFVIIRLPVARDEEL
jgi:uncharacterized membrane protein YbaN (DUF454 family)